MRAVDAAPVAAGAESPGVPYQLNRDDLVAAGRWRSYSRTLTMVVTLLMLQLPMWLVATGGWQPAVARSNEVPARLSLLVDGCMIAAYTVLAVRAWEITRFAPGCTRRDRALANVAVMLVAVGAVMDVVEDVVLWARAGAPEHAIPWVRGGVPQAFPPISLSWPPWTTVMRVLVLGGVVLGCAVAVRAARRPAPSWPLAAQPPQAGDAAADGQPGAQRQDRRADLIVCCSGGGIRAASFCLGGLQALEDRYMRASAVVGVSGGGYIAAAYHVHRWNPCRPGEEWGSNPEGLPYEPGSAEERWLRRHTRYLFDSPAAGVFALLSVLFGLAVNLLYITAALGASAWVFGWFMPASGGIRRWAGNEPVSNNYQGDWWWVRWVWLVAVAGVVLFVVAKVFDKVIGTLGFHGRERVRFWVVRLIFVGTGLTLVLIVLPWLLVELRTFARGEHTTGIAGALDNLLETLGFNAAPVTPAAQSEGGKPVPGASGATVSGTSLAAIAAAVLATIRVIGSTLTPSTDGKATSGLAQWAGKLWDKVKKVVIPWLAAIFVVTLFVVVLLAWTVGMLNQPDDLKRWALAGVYGGLVLATLALTDANRTSLHHFYRERLSTAYLVGEDDEGVPAELDYTQPLTFSKSRPPENGGPALISCAVANVDDVNLVPTGRDCTPFVFTHDRIGLSEEILPPEALVPAAVYEFAADSRGRDATIPAAVAISGAAFSPLVGRENAKVRPYRLVLALANARLGVWLPNPLWVEQEEMRRRMERAQGGGTWKVMERVRDVVSKPNAFLVGREAFGATSVVDRFLYVTDGGHYDNLGLVEALRRRPKTVLVLDASNDDEDSYATLGQAIATARMDLGCTVDFDPRAMRHKDKDRPKAAFGYGKITYRPIDGAPAETGRLWLAKAVMVDNLSWDLETYDKAHADFPRASTANQFYGEFDLEAYRALGAAVVGQLVAGAEKVEPPDPLRAVWPAPSPTWWSRVKQRCCPQSV